MHAHLDFPIFYAVQDPLSREGAARVQGASSHINELN